MLDWQKLLESIDACRPGSADLDAPEMQEVADRIATDEDARERYEQTQRQDAMLTRAFRDAEVPAGLEERLLAALKLQAVADEPTAAVATPPESKVPSELTGDAASPKSVPRSRRFWHKAALVGGLAAAASLLLTFWVTWNRSEPLTVQQLAELGRTWATAAAECGDSQWRPMQADDAPHLPWRPQRWMPWPTEMAGGGVVYDFRYRGGQRLMLFEITASTAAALPPIPYQTLPSTGPWQIGAWQENGTGRIYIAVTNHGPLLQRLGSPYRAT